jgi:hypothetical protein
MKIAIFGTLLCVFVLSSSIGFGQEQPDAIYIIFDASGSMWQKLSDGAFKIDVAKQVLQDFVASDFAGYELAFRAYGHRSKGDCRDSELIIPFDAPEKAVTQLKGFMGSVNPMGKTPISFSLREALKDFGDRRGEIILISDGEETCDDDPCALVREWNEQQVKIKVHVVGLGLDEKSKAAMQCISAAAGTEYRDAGSASELADGLKKIQQQTTWAGFNLEGVDEQGERIRVQGVLSRSGKEMFKVTDNGYNRVEAGEYTLTVGVMTKNGNLYKPVSQSVRVAEAGETRVKVKVVRPPSAKAKFIEEGEQQRGALITAYQSGQEVFTFRWMDEVFVSEGTYEFRAKPNAENELSVTETFAAGDRKEILFQMTHTVKATFKMLASGSGTWFRENYELWQNGELKYQVHAHNGAQVLPGTYELRLPNELTPFARPGIVITAENEQHFDVTVPVGHVSVIYQKADGTRDKDDRCFIGRGPTQKGKFKNGGEKIPLTPGTYNVMGWANKGNYERVVFEIKEAEEKEIVLRAK